MTLREGVRIHACMYGKVKRGKYTTTKLHTLMSQYTESVARR